MTTLNQTIKATANHSEKTFTIRTYVNGKLSTIYRTIRLPKYEFDSCLFNTEGDWKQFLKSDDYYVIK